MPAQTKSNVKVTINEWDGDRSSAAGGFTLIIKVGKEETEQRGGSYTTAEQRNKALAAIRRKGRKVAKDLNVELTEELIS